MPSSETFSLINQAIHALAPHYQDVVGEVFGDVGFNGLDWFLSFLAYGRRPDPVTVDFMQKLTPYTARDIQAERLAGVVERGFLQAHDDGYLASDQALQGVERFFNEANETLAQLEPLHTVDTERLAHLLQQIIIATAAASEPEPKHHFTLNRQTDPGPEAAAITRIDQYLTDLLRYRDDAHLAAWHPYGIDGATWEAFSFVWQEQAHTAAELAEQLPQRGHSEAVYEQALTTLVERGWLSEEGGRYTITDSGRQLRQEVEALTDKYFFIGWQGLSEAETAEVTRLLHKLVLEMNQRLAAHIWPTAQEVMNRFAPFYLNEMRQAIEASGAGPGWVILQAAATHAPEPITLDDIYHFFGYNARHTYPEKVALMLAQGLLQEVGPESYTLTEAGHQAIAAIYQAAQVPISQLEVLAEQEVEKLRGHLQQIVDATLAAPEPNLKASLLASRVTASGAAGSPLSQIDQYLTDLLRYRDDAHLAAWRAYDISGYAWEAFSFIWEGRAESVAELSEALSTRRGYSAEEYAETLQDLVRRSWLAEANGRYRLTTQGQELREAAERATDNYFYQGWLNLSTQALAQLQHLLNQLNDQLKLKGFQHAWQQLANLPARWYPLYREQTGAVSQEQGLNKPGAFLVLWQGLSFQPEPLSAANMQKQFPYISQNTYHNWFESLIEDGYLARSGEGEYTITEAGQAAALAVDDAFVAALGTLEPLPARQLEQLRDLMGKVADASLEAERPANKWAIETNRTIHRADDTPLLIQIDQYLDDLAAFRDDVHIASFIDYGIDGYGWELFTFIWRDGLNTPADLQQRLAFRGHDLATTTAFLDELVERGWLEVEDGAYHLTETGHEVRQSAEQMTDELFFAPWEEVLSLFELNHLIILAEQLSDALRELAGDKLTAERGDLYPLAGQVSQAIFANMREVVKGAAEATGLTGPGTFFLLLRALSYEPELVTAERIRLRAPYTNPQRYVNGLAKLAEAGWLLAGSNGRTGAYMLSAAARTAVHQYLHAFRAGLADLQPLPKDELERLADLLGRIIQAALQVPTPPGNRHLRDSRQIAPADDAPALVRIDQYLDDLNAFRDDAHIAAFQAHQVSGHAWEAFSYLWEDGPATAEEVAEKLHFRGYSPDDYTQALSGLVERGWLVEDEGTFRLSENGRQLREEVEQQTNRYFYLPWAALDKSETEELRQHLTNLEQALQQELEPTISG